MNKLILLLAFFATSALADELDHRQILNLTETQRNHVLTEMRALLVGTQSILAALANDDMAGVSASAKAIGFNMKHKAENPLHDVLPKDFMMLGMSMHKEFDRISTEAASIKDPKHTLKQISDTMGKCTACHAIYQIRPSSAANEARLDEVSQRGLHVMPFSLEKTTHVFTKTENGGVQQVIVKDKANTSQIRLIREHLNKIAYEFAQGDFSNPTKVHGETMPGLTKLRKAKPGQLKINYRDLDNGAEITYAAVDATLLKALHQWFDAQLRDHARHAVSGHTDHRMHGN